MKIFLTILVISYQLGNCQWVQQTVSVNKPITGIKFVDTLRGWACTDYGSQQDTGYILHTSNGGINWLIQVRTASTSFAVINILDSLTGYAAGYDNSIGLTKLFKTTNGGVNWNSTTLVPNQWIDDMQFLNRDSAWECGISAGPDVRTTTDGGMTWQYRQNGITSSNTRRLFFLNYNTGFCGASFHLYKTTNAGLNWTMVGNFSETPVGIFFLNNTTGWLAMTGNQVKYTTNSGTSWSTQTPDPVGSSTIPDIYFVNALTGWAGSAYLKIYKTTNSGVNWGYQVDSGGSIIISFTDSLHGWSGSSGVLGIYHTTNGGGQIIYAGLQTIGGDVPKDYKLYQNCPNPFNPSTNIKYQIINADFVSLKVYDILGRETAMLVNQNQKAGTYQIDFNAENLPSGVYFYRLITESFSETKKMTLIK